MHTVERLGDRRDSNMWAERDVRGYGLANAGERVGIGKTDSIYRVRTAWSE